MKRGFINLFFVALLMQSLAFKAQELAMSNVHVAKQHEETKLAWERAKLDDKGNYIINGVEFYSKKTNCHSEKVMLAKLVNTNNYSVKVSYQLNPESPVIYLRVPASSTIEGSCEATDENGAKLTIKMPETEDAKQKIKKHLLSHIIVSQTH